MKPKGSILNRFLIIVSLLGSTACSSTPEKPDEERRTNGMVAQEHFVQGVQKLDAQDYAGAVVDFKKASERDENRWDIHMNLAIALSRSAKFSEALGEIEKAFRAGGDKEALVYYNLGNIYQDRGMYTEATRSYRAALAMGDAKDIDTLINLAAAYLFSYEYENATATYEFVRSLAPDDPRAPHGLGLVLQSQNLYTDALAMYEEANRIDPNFSQAYFNKSATLAALQRWQEAIDAMETYLAKDPNGPYVTRANGHLRVYRQHLQNPS